MPRKITTVTSGEGMTFDEIASAIGSKKSAVSMVYMTAMRKLRAHPVLLAKLQMLAIELDKERNRRRMVEVE